MCCIFTCYCAVIEESGQGPSLAWHSAGEAQVCRSGALAPSMPMCVGQTQAGFSKSFLKTHAEYSTYLILSYQPLQIIMA